MSSHLPKELIDHFKEDAEFQKRFDRHMEIYAQNGRELAALKEIVHELSRDVKKHVVETEKMIKFFNGMSFMQKAAMWILGVIAAVGTAFILLRDIFK